MSSSSSSSPCAACSFLKRVCTKECVFAPYFPAEDLKKFMDLERVYEPDNIERILNKVEPKLRECAVNTLCFEAQQRIQNPAYGSVALILSLQEQLRQIHHELAIYREKYGIVTEPVSHKETTDDYL